MIRQVPLGGGADGSAQLSYPPITEFDVSPVEGQTVTCPSTTNDTIIRLTPSGSLNSIGVVLPAPDPWRIVQKVFIHCTQDIAEIDVSGGPGVSVDNPVLTFQKGGCFAFFRVSSTTWARILS